MSKISLKKLLALRHEHLAHRQLAPATANLPDATDDEIEQFYQDNSSLVRTLLSLANAMAYDPSETADVYQYYARKFWAGVQGEQNEGHPDYRERRV